MTANAPIDFENEANDLTFELDGGYFPFRLEQKTKRDRLMGIMQSIAERVESQTIERCSESWFQKADLSEKLPRLYGPKSDKEEGSL